MISHIDHLALTAALLKLAALRQSSPVVRPNPAVAIRKFPTARFTIADLIQIDLKRASVETAAN